MDENYRENPGEDENITDDNNKRCDVELVREASPAAIAVPCGSEMLALFRFNEALISFSITSSETLAYEIYSELRLKNIEKRCRKNNVELSRCTAFQEFQNDIKT